MAKWLHARLERFPLSGLAGRETELGPVPKRLQPIFRYRDFFAGVSLSDETIAALSASAALIVLCSPTSAESHYVNEQVRFFKHRCPDRPIVAVIVAGKSDGGEQKCFPPTLRFELNSDGRTSDRAAPPPFAADMRKGGGGHDLALTKVVAALIGVPFDEVDRRRKRHARLRYAGAGFALLAGTGGYLGWRQVQRAAELARVAPLVDQYAPVGSAQTQQPGARERLKSAFETIVRGAADPRYKQALDLIKAGKPKEAEPLMRAVAEGEEAGLKRRRAAEKWRAAGAIAGFADPKKARAYYAKAADLDPDDIRGLMWHAEMEQDAGDLAEAERAYSVVLKSGARSLDDHELLRARLGLGKVLEGRGKLPEALKAHQQAVADGERLIKAAPNDPNWRRDLSTAYGGVGDVLKDQGDLFEAAKAYRDSLDIRERLAKANPDNAEWRRDLSVAYNKVGDVLVEEGNLPEALNAYRDGLDIFERLAKADPGNSGRQRDLAVSYERVGDVLRGEGNAADALKAYRDGLAIAERLANADADNQGSQRDLSVAYNKVGDVLTDQGNLPEALKAYHEALRIRERLAKTDPGNAGWQRDLAVADNKVGDVLADQGNLPDALNVYREGLAIRERVAKADPANAAWQADLAASHGKLGKLYVRMGDKAEARRMFEQGRAIVAPFAEKSGHQLWIGYQTSFEEALAALGK